jgi:hypothetical protein
VSLYSSVATTPTVMARMKKEPTDLTVEILKQIRDAVAGTNERLDRTNERLDETRRELSERIGRVEARFVDTELRVATELTSVVGAVHAMRDAFLEDRALRRTVDDHERRLRTIERKTG